MCRGQGIYSREVGMPLRIKDDYDTYANIFNAIRSTTLDFFDDDVEQRYRSWRL